MATRVRQAAFLMVALAFLAAFSIADAADAAANAAAAADDKKEAATNETEDTGVNCVEGLIVPLWKPTDNMSLGDRLEEPTNISKLNAVHVMLRKVLRANCNTEQTDIWTDERTKLSVEIASRLR